MVALLDQRWRFCTMLTKKSSFRQMLLNAGMTVSLFVWWVWQFLLSPQHLYYSWWRHSVLSSMPCVFIGWNFRISSTAAMATNLNPFRLLHWMMVKIRTSHFHVYLAFLWGSSSREDEISWCAFWVWSWTLTMGYCSRFTTSYIHRLKI